MCPGTHTPQSDTGRRRFLATAIAALHGAIGATLAFILGGAVAAPAFGTRRTSWWPATAIDDLTDDEPRPVAIRVTREDGYSQVVERQVVFLVKSGAQVTALSSTCTHLGCRVSWNADEQLLKCPCHGGKFDKTGAVKDGPPPAPLVKLATRIEGEQILVEL